MMTAYARLEIYIYSASSIKFHTKLIFIYFFYLSSRNRMYIIYFVRIYVLCIIVCIVCACELREIQVAILFTDNHSGRYMYNYCKHACIVFSDSDSLMLLIQRCRPTLLPHR